MRKKVFALLFILVSFSAIAQIKNEKRIEFEQKNGYVDEEIFEFGEHGFLIRSKSEGSLKEKRKWHYELFNSDLISVQEKSIYQQEKFLAHETYASKTNLHTLFKGRKGDYSLVSIDASSFTFKEVKGVLPKKMQVKGMMVLGDYAFFNASIKRIACLFSINWKTGDQKIIPIKISDYKDRQISIHDFQLMEETNEVFVYVKVRPLRKFGEPATIGWNPDGGRDILAISTPSSKVRETYVVRLDAQGEEQGFFNLSIQFEKNVIDVSASSIGNGEYIYTGTYASNSIVTSQGVFVCKTSGNDVVFARSRSFVDMENFHSYLSDKQQERFENKKKRKESKGLGFDLNYHIATHDIIKLKDGYLLVGEAYYPTYTTEQKQKRVFDNVSNEWKEEWKTVTVFDGYQYTHAFLAKISFEGKLVWDETFELWSTYRPHKVKRFISVAEENQNSIRLVYVSGDEIKSKEIDYNGVVLQDAKTDWIETGVEGDESKYATADISYWYGNYFITYGSQTIKNKENEKAKRRRKVFFVSKIAYE